MSSCWLLLLGSTLADDERVHAALRALAELGPARLLAPIRHGPGSGDARRSYFNALVEIHHDGDAAQLVAACKAIERRLGRRRDVDEVAIDIDLLARWSDGAWRADAHALAKGEFGQPHALALFADAGITVDTASRS